jgi:xanthine dehydrogenase small subunit
MAANSATLRFVLDGRIVSLERPRPTQTVLEYLRESGRCGTKEGCAEGDCGACTVVLGELDRGGDRVTYRAVNSCIRFLPTLDGCELVTVESLRQPSGLAHPVQQSLIDHHGSQCGFCTPGFVMSLFAMYLHQPSAGRGAVVDALAGNLCRCTGYRPIIEAGLRLGDYPAPEHWSREAATAPSHAATLQSLDRGELGESLRYPGYHAPRDIDELAAAVEADPDATLLAGGTDVGLWVTKQLRELPSLLYIGDVRELSLIERRPGEWWFGAAVTLSDAWPALVEDFPDLAEQAARFASPPIRNSATLCGNLVNGSPIGDSIPMLIALGATLELRRGRHKRRLPLEDFYIAYRKTALEAGEFVTGVAVPHATGRPLIASYKVSKRIEQDISAVSATFCVHVEGGSVIDARLAFGGLAGTARRARHAERALIEGGWGAPGIEAAIEALAADFQPLSDLRATSAYRLRAAGNLLRRFLLQHQSGGVAVRIGDVAEPPGAA